MNSTNAYTAFKRLIVITALSCSFGASDAWSTPISIKLTADGLGLGNADINKGGQIDLAYEILGTFWTGDTGVGSTLNIQRSGTAGPGTTDDPLFVTLTAQTHLDTLYGLPTSPHDYLAGVIYISKESTHTPDGRDEGIGVRAFKVDQYGLRTFSQGAAQLEGSKDVSGGTGPDTFVPGDPNGAPHVDEGVMFDYAVPVIGRSIEIMLSKFESTDIVDLHIERTVGEAIDLTFLQTADTDLFEQIGGEGDKLWKLKFSAASIGLGADDMVTSFIVRANDDNPLVPSGTAEHFLITGATAEIPAPATLWWLLIGGATALRRRA
jgi:hypothetical protein